MIIILKSSDGEEFAISEAVARQSRTICHLIKDDCAENIVSLPNVNAKILAKVIEYRKRNVADVEEETDWEPQEGGEETSIVEFFIFKTPQEERMMWKKGFLNVDIDTLDSLILAANYLNLEGLLDMVYEKVADILAEQETEIQQENPLFMFGN